MVVMVVMATAMPHRRRRVSILVAAVARKRIRRSGSENKESKLTKSYNIYLKNNTNYFYSNNVYTLHAGSMAYMMVETLLAK
jgi:hypothetical protein